MAKRKKPSHNKLPVETVSTIVNVKKSSQITEYLVKDQDKYHWTTNVSNSDIKLFESVRLSGKGSLEGKYIVPPMDLIRLNSKNPSNRRDEWKELFQFEDTYLRQNIGRKFGSSLNRPTAAVSEYNPVIAELMYSWYCGLGKSILDPFAGGPFKGLIAAILGCSFTGVEIREEQVKYNMSCASKMKVSEATWLHGDSRNLAQLLPIDKKYDMLFSCPPYGNLEKYSELDGDLSNMPVDAFWKSFSEIITAAIGYLQDSAFVVLQVANFYVNQGEMFPFDSKVVNLLTTLGLKMHSQATLQRKYGEAAARCASQFPKSRKLTKVSERLLIFYKGKALSLLEQPEYNVLVSPTKRKSVKVLYEAYVEHCSNTNLLPAIDPPKVNNTPEESETCVTLKEEYMSPAEWKQLSNKQRKHIHNRKKKKQKRLMQQEDL